jgi:YidC/Oxa1 family membrane protein insertase
MLAILMPVIMGFSLWRYASGIALYWATGNLVNLIIQLLINRTRMGKEMHTIAAMRQEPRP